MSTEELGTFHAPSSSERTRFGRRWRGFTGLLAVGLGGLAVIVLGSALICALLGAPGPGVMSLVAHPLAAVLALAAQHVANRRDGKPAGVAGIVVLAQVVFVLVVFWWWA